MRKVDVKEKSQNLKADGFVGYWGRHSSPELETTIWTAIFKKVTTKESTKVFTTERSKMPATKPWQVCYFCREEISTPTAKNIIASVSVSGFNNSADVWVKLENDSLILGREPFGRVPLYWLEIEGVIWFASKIQLLLPIIAKPEVNIAGLYGYSCFSYFPNPLTPVEGIFAVEAGTEISWHPEGKRAIKRHYQWRESRDKINDENEAISRLQKLLKDAIGRQIVDLPAEPVGVFLSGGIDSSTVAALLVEAGVKVRGYTLDFGEKCFPEWEYAELVAKHLDIPLIKVPVTPRRVKKALLPTVEALDLPFGDGVTVPLYLLCQAAREETSVIFNGEGGDQLFAGWTNKPLIAAAVYRGNNYDLVEEYLQTFHRLWGYEDAVFPQSVGEEIVHNLEAGDWIKEALDDRYCPSLLDKLRRGTLMLKGAQNIHPRATNLAFANGLWARSLFCDLALAEFSFRLPGEFYLRGSCEKYLLKKAVENWLPPEVVWREKRGMGVPLNWWCFNGLYSEIRRWLNPGLLANEGRFISDIAIKVIRGKLGGQIRSRRIGEILWLLMVWEIWRLRVLGESAVSESFYNPLWLPPRWWQLTINN
ncbi:MAG: asparagine synthetase B family protein [Cyanobacteriota bacterium]|nr:asparagine synthetase B family protein [Cyanobacteriota bacterium]